MVDIKYNSEMKMVDIMLIYNYCFFYRYFSLVSTMDNSKNMKDQLLLLHQRLIFEKHQREIASYRNRRLLLKVKNKKTLEEYNSALVSSSSSNTQ